LNNCSCSFLETQLLSISLKLEFWSEENIRFWFHDEDQRGIHISRSIECRISESNTILLCNSFRTRIFVFHLNIASKWFFYFHLKIDLCICWLRIDRITNSSMNIVRSLIFLWE
jgi:hypothetical protein